MQTILGRIGKIFLAFLLVSFLDSCVLFGLFLSQIDDEARTEEKTEGEEEEGEEEEGEEEETGSGVLTFTVGGTVSGLSGTLVLQNNGVDDLTLTDNSSFTFESPLEDGEIYEVTVKTQPSDQSCTVENGSGTINGADITNVSVSCVSLFTVGGTVSDLSGTLVLQNNGEDDLTITGDGSFTFKTSLEDGTIYEVTVVTQPADQTCTVTNGNGMIAGENVTTVTVTCLSANANLSALEVSTGSLSPGFDSEITSYSLSVNFLTALITVTPTTEDSGAGVTVNGTSVSSGSASDSISLGVGSNTITSVVTAADGTTTQTYTVTATREASNDFAQQAFVKASNAGSTDLFGGSVSISEDTLVAGAVQEDSNATGVNGGEADNSAVNSGAAYVSVRDGTIWSQQAYLKASNTEGGDSFGRSVAVSGDTIVVGAEREQSDATGMNGDESNNNADDSGAAYVFVRNGTTWSQQAYLKASNTEAIDIFGDRVAIDGDTIVVAARGEDSDATGVNGDESNNNAGSSGAAYVFVRNGTTWTQQAYLKASNSSGSDFFGMSVAISGDTIVVGASGEDSGATGVNGDETDNSESTSGAAYVFVRNGTTWTQQAYLKASNTEQDDQFGMNLGISGDTIVVGARLEDSDATGVNGDETNNNAGFAGAAYVFVRNGTTWSQQAYLKASNTQAGDQFGRDVAISGDTIAVAARGEDSSATGVDGDDTDNSASNSGAAYVFVRNGTTWTLQFYLKASNTSGTDFFGTGLSASGDTIVVGADNQAADSSGAIYVYE